MVDDFDEWPDLASYAENARRTAAACRAVIDDRAETSTEQRFPGLALLNQKLIQAEAPRDQRRSLLIDAPRPRVGATLLPA